MTLSCSESLNEAVYRRTMVVLTYAAVVVPMQRWWYLCSGGGTHAAVVVPMLCQRRAKCTDRYLDPLTNFDGSVVGGRERLRLLHTVTHRNTQRLRCQRTPAEDAQIRTAIAVPARYPLTEAFEWKKSATAFTAGLRGQAASTTHYAFTAPETRPR